MLVFVNIYFSIENVVNESEVKREVSDNRCDEELNQSSDHSTTKSVKYKVCRRISKVKALSRLNRRKPKQKLKAEPKRGSVFSCDWPECKYKAKYRSVVDRHKKEAHYGDSPLLKYVCEYPGCGKKFKHKRSFGYHLECHKSEEQMKCEICDQDCKSGKGLKVHMIRQHKDVKTFTCDQPGCLLVTINETRFYSHTHVYHSKQSIRCTVEGCDKVFTTKYALKTHLDSHNTEPVYKCPFEGCTKSYRIKLCLNSHYRNRHIDRKPYPCDWPGCEFVSKSPKCHRRHKYVHKTERDFLCDWPECGKGFKSKRQLRLHIRIHTNDKRYVCLWPGCQYATSDSANSLKHRKQVHEKSTQHPLNKK